MAQKIIKFLTCGNVDDGKSTLIGRLLHDTDSLYHDQIEEVKKSTEDSFEGELDFSLFLDGLTSERAQKITIDAAYRYFSYGDRKLIIADSPGHEQYTRNMAVASSNSDIAIILIDATKGIKTQTIRHTFINHLFGIKHIIIAVNKMDLVGFNQTVFDSICEQYKTKISSLEFDTISFVPIAAKLGENIVEKGQKFPWYNGKTIIETLLAIEPQTNKGNDLRLSVQNVVKQDTKRFYQGVLAGGVLKRGDKVLVYPAKEFVHVTEIVRAGEVIEEAKKSHAVMISIDREIDLDRGGLISDSENPSHFVNRFCASLIWFSDKEWAGSNAEYLLKINHNYVRANIKKINHLTDVDTLSDYQSYSMRANQIANVNFDLAQNVAVDLFSENKNTGSFLLIDKDSNETVACGVITDFVTEKKDAAEKKQTNQQEFLRELSGLIKKYFGENSEFDFSI